MRRFAALIVTINLLIVGAIALAHPAGTSTAAADSAAAAQRGLIALTARNRTGDEVLYLIDPENRQLVAYEVRPKGLKIVAARKLDFDFRITSYRDANDKGFTYEDLKRRFTKPAAPRPIRPGE